MLPEDAVQSLSARAGSLWEKNRAPFLTALAVGFCAHGYAFSNKLLNHDEIESLFGKGATVTSGRWGLELVKPLFPDWSMPWIYGIISLVFIAAAACLMLETLEIRSRALRVLLPAVIVSFPSLTGNFCFMFTAAPYAWSFFLTALAVYLICRGGAWRLCLSVVLLGPRAPASLRRPLLWGDAAGLPPHGGGIQQLRAGECKRRRLAAAEGAHGV